MADIFNFYVYDDRSIRYELAEPIMLEDKDVTQFQFRIPKVLNNIDMTSWEWWFIFVNAKKIKYTTQLTLTDDEDDPDNFSVATYTVGYGFSGYVGTVSFSIEALNVSDDAIVNEWHTKTYTTRVLDTLQGTRAVIPEPEADAGTGLTAEEKSLILELFSKAAYAEDDASTAYDRLEALWAVITRLVSLNLTHVTSSNQSASVENGSRYVTTLTADANYTINSVTVIMGGVDITSTSYSSGTVTIPSVTGNIVITATAVLAAQSITATYTQSGTVYNTDSLDSLKADLVVTANYSGGGSDTIPSTDYTLSGTLTVGASTITVTYAGLTDTFSVTVTANYVTDGLFAHWDAIDNQATGTHDSSATTWVDLINGHTWTAIVTDSTKTWSWGDNSLILSSTAGGGASSGKNGFKCTRPNVGLRTLEIVFTPNGNQTACVGEFTTDLTGITDNTVQNIAVFTDNTVTTIGVQNGYQVTDITSINSISATYNSSYAAVKCYKNSTEVTTQGSQHSFKYHFYSEMILGSQNNSANLNYAFKGTIHAIRMYNRELTAEEIATNYAVDVERFSLT